MLFEILSKTVSAFFEVFAKSNILDYQWNVTNARYLPAHSFGVASVLHLGKVGSVQSEAS